MPLTEALPRLAASSQSLHAVMLLMRSPTPASLRRRGLPATMDRSDTTPIGIEPPTRLRLSSVHNTTTGEQKPSLLADVGTDTQGRRRSVAASLTTSIADPPPTASTTSGKYCSRRSFLMRSTSAYVGAPMASIRTSTSVPSSAVATRRPYAIVLPGPVTTRARRNARFWAERISATLVRTRGRTTANRGRSMVLRSLLMAAGDHSNRDTTASARRASSGVSISIQGRPSVDLMPIST